jgi:hypothetical protein
MTDRKAWKYPVFLLFYPLTITLFLADGATFYHLPSFYCYAFLFSLGLFPGWLLHRAVSPLEDAPLLEKASWSLIFSFALYTPAALVSLLFHFSTRQAAALFVLTGLLTAASSLVFTRKNRGRGPASLDDGFNHQDPSGSSSGPPVEDSIIYPLGFLGALLLTGLACRPGLFRGGTYYGGLELGFTALFFSLASAAALVLYIRTFRSGRGGGGFPSDMEQDIPLMILKILALGLGAYLLRLSACHDTAYKDTFSYLSVIGDYLDSDSLNLHEARLGLSETFFRDRIFVWGLAQAILARAGGIDPVIAHNTVLNILLIPLALGAAYALGRRILNSRQAGLASVSFLCIIALTTTIDREVFQGHTMINRFLMNRLPEDKALLWLIFLPLTMAALFSWMRDGGRRRFAAALMTLAAMAAIHPLGLSFAGYFLAVLLLAVPLFTGRRKAFLRWLMILPPLLPLLLLPLSIKTDLSHLTARILSHSEGMRVFMGHWHNLLDVRTFQFADGFLVLREFWLTRSPGILLAVLMAPLSLLALFRVPVFVLAAGAIGVVWLAYNPLIFPLTAPFIHPVIAFRLLWLIPAPQILAMASILLAGHLPRGTWRKMAVPAVIVSLLTAGWLIHHPAEPLEGLRWRADNLYKISDNKLAIFQLLKGSAAGKSLIFAPREINLLLPAFLPDATLLEYRAQQTFYFMGAEKVAESAERLRDYRLLYLDLIGPYQAGEIIDKYRPGAVVTRSAEQEALKEALKMDPDWQMVLDNDHYRLYFKR